PVGALSAPVTYEKARKFWWRQNNGGVSCTTKGVRPRTKGKASPDPKGFIGALPITRVQPSFRTLRNRSLTGDYAMAETVNRDRARGLAVNTSGAASMYAGSIRQSALRFAADHWRSFQPPVEAIEALEFEQTVEFSHTTKLLFHATGFNFNGAP